MAERLLDRYDAVLSDLDGVVYAGPHAIPGAPEVLRRISEDGVPVVFVTNNASRSVATVAEHLTDLGVPTGPDGVVSAAQAGAELLAQRVPAGTAVLVTGSQALADVVAEAGLVPVRAQSDEPRAVIQGFDPGLGWAELAEAAYTLADPDVLWVATNTDRTIPQARGLAPGNGTLVAAVAATTARPPVVAGKPEAPIFRTAAERAGSARPVVLGDRLDTDIRGGNAAGFATIAVLTGVRCIRARLTAFGERTTSIREPGGSSVVRRPSHHSTPRASVRVRTSTAIMEFGEMTRGRENRAWALRGTMSSASTSGHTTGPPAENA